MKVTVIATGFDRAGNSSRRQTVTPVDIANYTQPQEIAVGSEEFYRTGGENVAADLDFSSAETEEGEDLDVPAYLRRSKS